MFFVSGITGKVGGATARRLLESGHKVRTLVRDPKKAAEWSVKGVEVRQGDLEDADILAEALEGVEGAYMMMPPVMAPAPGCPEAKAPIESYVKALRKAPPPRVAVLSSMGSEKSSKLGNITATHLLEGALHDVTFPVAFVRAGSFFENYLFNLKSTASSGWFDTFLQPTNRPVPMVATVDIGNEIGRLLAEGWSGKKVIELGSYVSPDDLASAMGEVIGRTVKARAVPRESWTAALEGMGMPQGRTSELEQMQDSINSGWIDFGVPGTERVGGTATPAQTFAAAAKAQ